MSVCVIQFAKAPVPGAVKTRLQPRLSPEQSAHLHRQLVIHCHAGINAWCNGRADRVPVLAITPEVHPFWQGFVATGLWPQPEGDLGKRMQAAVDWGLVRADWVILVGSDCPALDADYLQQALDALTAGADLVIGPALDGGYVLLAMSAPVPVFEGVAWGTDQVLAQTKRLAAAVGLVPQLLPSLPDIDRPEDLQQLVNWSHLADWARIEQK